MRIPFLAGLGLLLSLPVNAEIYKYIDQSGHITYSNLPIKGAKKLDLPDLSTVPGTKPVQSSTPSGFPKIDSRTQKDRDDVRRKILEDELKSEEAALTDAREALQQGEGIRLGNEHNYQKYLDRIQKLKDSVAQHEGNITAIRKELSELK